MPTAHLVELFNVAFPDEISGNADEAVRRKIEREVPHTFREGPPDDIYHRGGVTTYGVFYVKYVADPGLEQIMVGGNGADVVEHLGFFADGNPGSGGDLEIAIYA